MDSPWFAETSVCTGFEMNPCKQGLGLMWDPLPPIQRMRWGRVWDTFGMRSGRVWDAFRTRLGCVWDAFGMRLGRVWDSNV